MWLDTDVKLIQPANYELTELLLKFEKLLYEHDWSKLQLQRSGPLEGSSVIFHQLYFPVEQNINDIKYDPIDLKLQNISYELINSVMQLFPNYTILKGEISTCMPGVEQRTHVDPRVFHRFSKRLHLPIITNDFSFLEVDNTQYHLEKYNIYEFNNLKPHRSLNLGNTIRTHIIIDIIDQTWLNKILETENISVMFEYLNNEITDPNKTLAGWKDGSFLSYLKYSNACYIPLSLPANPLVNLDKVFHTVKNTVCTDFKKDILKPELIELFESRNLRIEKVVIWQWDLNTVHNKLPHTDGNLNDPTRLRLAGVNWLIHGNSALDFWKIENAETVFKETDITYYTDWIVNPGDPDESWDGAHPSLVNPQKPHRVRKTGKHNIRRAVVVVFDNKTPFNEVAERLSDIFYVNQQ